MPLTSTHYELLKKKLESEFVPLLPQLLDNKKPVDEQNRKNLSRAFSAFALHHICGIKVDLAAASVIDDFDDKGIDAIYYDAANETLYLVQGKFKATEQFNKDEAADFCYGIRKIVSQDLDNFNQHVIARKTAIEDAVENCSAIRLIIAHIGGEISFHASEALNELFKDEQLDEERLLKPVIDYDAERVVKDLRESYAYKPINETLLVHKCATVITPRTTYIGFIPLVDLVKLHTKYDVELYEQNIRNSLGNKTDVNIAIQRTLQESPEDFFYLNNGVTALCQRVEIKGSKAGKAPKKLIVKGLSIINGAQTVASTADFLAAHPEAKIESARVTFTLIVVPAGDAFGKTVTRARNHQNPVSIANFAALDDEQERLRRELAQLDIHYVYKRGVSLPQNGSNVITIDEAAFALALFQRDPRYAVWLKREPGRFLNTKSEEYQAIFTSALTVHQLVNAVYFSRQAQELMEAAVASSGSPERLIYRHGMPAFGWVLAKRVRDGQQAAKLFDTTKLANQLSRPADELRQLLLDEATARTADKGPLALFKNQTDVVSLLDTVASTHYGLAQDAALGPLRQQQQAGQDYPKGLFTFLAAKAPQISNLV